MRPNSQLGPALVRTLGALAFLLALTFLFGAGTNSIDVVRDGHQAAATKMSKAGEPPSPPAAFGPSAAINQRKVTRYVMGSNGDRSLDAATIVEQIRTGFIRYKVGLQLASGAEQWLALAAPPGGLRVEMRDMTGDNVPNDLVVTPALLHWPLSVLLNEGHDHFVVAVSGNFPGSLGSGSDRASRARDVHYPALLISSSYKIGSPRQGGELFAPRPQEGLLLVIAQSTATRLAFSSRFGRAPPIAAI
jgi:hypothetical protein